MRTEHRQFAEILHRLRNLRHQTDKNGKITNKLEPMRPEDVEFLNDNCQAHMSDPDYDPLSLHIFYKNEQVNEQNRKALHHHEMNGYKLEDITAKDSFVDSTFVTESTRAKILLGLKHKWHIDTGQLHYSLQIGMNCRVSLTTNIDVQDGLVNGAMGTIKYFTKTGMGKFHIIWVEFDDKNIGLSLRRTSNGLYQNNKQLEKSWTPIVAIYKQFQTGAMGKKKHYLISRIQFPIEIAFAKTLTKMQGMSLDFKHYINFEDLRKHGKSDKHTQHNEPNAYVVGLSRATNPSNLKFLNGFKESQIGRNYKADNEVDRLRDDPSAKIVFTVPDLLEMEGIKIVFYNLQGLQSSNKLEKLTRDTNLMATDILLGAETNLNNKSTPDQYTIPGFQSKLLIGNTQQIGRGLILYSKTPINDNNIQQIMRNDIEFGRYKTSIKGKDIVVIFIYRSERYNISLLRNDLMILVDELQVEKNVLIIGDMNTEECLIQSNKYQQIIQSTTTSGLHGKIIDQAYVKLTDFHATGFVLYKSFIKSHHHPICINLKLKQI
jgi:hypothetical protein